MKNKTRLQLANKVRKNLDKIKKLEDENIELLKQSYLITDKTQRFEEKIEHHKKGRGHKTPHYYDGKLIGRIYWKEFFYDGSYPDDKSKGIWINRSQVVRVDGEWVF